MSKKIWRGHQYGDGIDGKNVTESTRWREERNCTVVPDSACFPVKEAIAFMREMDRMTEFGEIDRKQWTAWTKYLSAVERMQKKEYKAAKGAP